MIPDILRIWGAAPTSNVGLIWVLNIFLFSYLIGSIPFGILISRLFKLGNIRDIGSGNIGATNVLRTGHKKAAFFTLIMDITKGIAVVYLAEEFLGITASHFAALGVFFGHLFSIFLFSEIEPIIIKCLDMIRGSFLPCFELRISFVYNINSSSSSNKF